MRVLHIGKFYPPAAGGIESFMGDLLPALAARGHDVMALVHTFSEKGPDKEFDRCFTDRGVTVVPVPCWGQVLYAPISPAFPWYLQRLMRRFRPQLLHLHVPNTSVFWVLGNVACRKIPWILHWHADVVPSRIDKRLAVAYTAYQPLERWLLRRAARVIVTSAAYQATSAPLQQWQSRCRMIPLGLDARRLLLPTAPERQWAETVWNPKAGRILSVGRLTYYKGYDVLLTAISQVPEAQLVIVGTGEQRNALERQITALNLSFRVTLTGYLPSEKLQALLATCDIFCLSSLERTEAFGMVLLEAMRYAKPLVVTDISGSGTGWVSGAPITGQLVPPDDAPALAAAIKTLCNNMIKRQQCGNAALQRFTREFQIETVAAKVENVYGELV